MKSNKKQRFSPLIRDLIVIALLFLVAFSIRIRFQTETIVDHPIRADAREYLIGAYNLRYFGVFSTEPPSSPNLVPRPNASRVPGYSLFLSLFMDKDKPTKHILTDVKATQALFGSLVTVMSYVLARFCFSLPLAFVVGCLTGLSPHLVSIDNYLLAESLYTFLTMGATLAFIISWKKKNWLLALLAGGLFGFSTLTRPVALLLGPFIALIYAVDKQGLKFTPIRIMLKMFLCFFLGITLTYGSFLVRNRINLEQTSDIGGLLGNIVFGTYINLTHEDPAFYGFPYKDDPECQRMRKDWNYFFEVFKKRFQDDPWSYIRWYAGGKILCSWRWDIASGMGDVYIYPVERGGFHSDSLLRSIHAMMRLLHWPLVILGFLNPFILLLYFGREKPNQPEYLSYLPAIFMIVYHAIIFTILFPLPRYTIPLRPYCYLLAVGTLSILTRWAYNHIKRPGPINPEAN